MADNTFVLDKEFVINIENMVNGSNIKYDYKLDYDITIKRNLLPNGNYVYTAIYNIDTLNEISNITNPYSCGLNGPRNISATFQISAAFSAIFAPTILNFASPMKIPP